MGDITYNGQERIQSNDGTLQIGITERDLTLTKPDVAAVDATDKDLILNDEQNVSKTRVKQSTTISHAANNETTMLTIPHGLDDAPIIEAFVHSSTGARYNLPWVLPLYAGTTNRGKIALQLSSSSDETNIYFTLDTPNITDSTTYGTVFSLPIVYYVRQETAS